ncbi:hypothetical protein LXD69_13145 [Flavobacterium sediminilitoris]|uniref:Bacteriocin-like protein n=1 Tax=Flavobacterium sediminilitoris TaxID=2024526 RepID=A0ABY4HNA7_9FLAO|nr:MULTISPECIES: hypothetical protein [Flavobacterium]UOX32979.1 hypothetical protein LXD69_13145 [Flavobacterium sediminilitoris]
MFKDKFRKESFKNEDFEVITVQQARSIVGGACSVLESCTTYNGSCPHLTSCGTYSSKEITDPGTPIEP